MKRNTYFILAPEFIYFLVTFSFILHRSTYLIFGSLLIDILYYFFSKS